MHKLESFLENEIHDILWNFVIQMDHPVLSRRLDLALINKRKRICHLEESAIPVDYRVKILKRGKKTKQILGSCQGVEKAVEYPPQAWKGNYGNGRLCFL